MNPMQLCGVAPHPIYACCLPCVRFGPKSYVETKCFVSYSFDSINGAHKSKNGHL